MSAAGRRRCAPRSSARPATPARSHDLQIRAGISSACNGLAEIARGYVEARRALRHAAPGGAIALDQIPLVDYLADQADDGAQRLVAPAAAAIAADPTVAQTLRAYADCDMNVARTAERLVVHPNTVHYRLRRVAEATGRDPRRFGDLLDLLLAIRLGESSRNA